MDLTMNLLLAIATFVVAVMGDITHVLDEINVERKTELKKLPESLQEDAKLSTSEMIKKYGYPCEDHTVVSKDGYVLKMHRIPYGRSGPSNNRSAVYVQHGFLCSSVDWIISGPGKALGYYLADAGYDVWLGNVRGNTYSRKHTKWDPKKDAKQFWDFSWHEIGMDDIPTMVDYVRKQTGQDKIFYIGHSQGTTVSYVMLSQKTEYNSKFRAVISLAPIAYMGRVTSPFLKTFSLFEHYTEWIVNMLNIYEFLPRTGNVAAAGGWLCKHSMFQKLCAESLFTLCGYNREQMNITLVPVIMSHTPAGASIKQFLHFVQEINSEKFRQWDYGIVYNRVKYKRWSPPDYELENVKAPVYLYYTHNDWLAHVEDVEKLASELGNLKGKFLCSDKNFNHIDYMYGIDAPTLVYNDILETMKKH
ncbi:hypothetical protein ILUMI_01486 [Ignelater luminosus]|uniref:Lipase n=1 Tax=Ignelater luminosus TaxID=2038154 RepID=A0A8K0DFA3_IGNLU|nr:hypothetical protein ILUMI_01486 [Ignelater luminosus]